MEGEILIGVSNSSIRESIVALGLGLILIGGCNTSIRKSILFAYDVES